MATKRPKPQRPETTSIRLDEADWQLVQALRAATGIKGLSDLLRHALRELAAKKGIR